MINNKDIQRLRDLSIEGVAERLGLRVKRHLSLCPFHSDHHSSLHFNLSKNRYKCFVCGAHGDCIDLTMNHLHLSFSDACRWLADESNIILSDESSRVQNVQKLEKAFDASRYARYFEHPFLNDIARNFLFDNRHLDPRVVTWCRLNSYREWLQIPYFDIEGKLIGIQKRYLGKDKSQPRFRFPPGAQCHVYNLPVIKLLRPNEALYITEGASDCWAMLSSGRKAIAIPSATLLKPNDLKPLETCHQELGTTFHMYPDQDAPGARLFLDLKQRLLGLVHHQLPEQFKDFGDYWKSICTESDKRNS